MADKMSIRNGTQVPDFGSWVEALRGLRDKQGIDASAEDRGQGAEMPSTQSQHSQRY